MTAFDPGGDLCVGFFAEHWNRGALSLPHGARVLEIGCAEGNWLRPMQTARKDLSVIGIDVRPVEREGAIVADVLTHDFPPASFDAIVAVSTIEHVGLGYYGDPLDEDGDIHALVRAAGWLAPDGWIYLDVPTRPPGGYIVTREFRAYDPDALHARLVPPGLRIRWTAPHPSTHPDGPYTALVLEHAT